MRDAISAKILSNTEYHGVSMEHGSDTISETALNNEATKDITLCK